MTTQFHTATAPSVHIGVEDLAVDIRQRYVRVTSRRADGLVAFEFAIGWPELFVELLLPRLAFEQFCLDNQVRPTDA